MRIKRTNNILTKTLVATISWLCNFEAFECSNCPSMRQQSVFVHVINGKAGTSDKLQLERVGSQLDCELECVDRFDCSSYDYSNVEKRCELHFNDAVDCCVQDDQWVHVQKRLVEYQNEVSRTTPRTPSSTPPATTPLPKTTTTTTTSTTQPENILNEEYIAENETKVFGSWSIECEIKIPKGLVTKHDTIKLLQMNSSAGEIFSLRLKGEFVTYNYQLNKNRYKHQFNPSPLRIVGSNYVTSVNIQHQRLNKTHYIHVLKLNDNIAGHNFKEDSTEELVVKLIRTQHSGDDEIVENLKFKDLPDVDILSEEYVVGNSTKMLASWSIECRIKVPTELDSYNTLNLVQINSSDQEFFSIRTKGQTISLFTTLPNIPAPGNQQKPYTKLEHQLPISSNDWTDGQTTNVTIQRMRINLSQYNFKLCVFINGTMKYNHSVPIQQFNHVVVATTRYITKTGQSKDNANGEDSAKGDDIARSGANIASTIAMGLKLHDLPDGSDQEGNTAKSCQYLSNTFPTYESGVYRIAGTHQHSYCDFLERERVLQHPIVDDAEMSIGSITKSWWLRFNITLRPSNTDVYLPILLFQLSTSSSPSHYRSKNMKLFTKGNQLYFEERWLKSDKVDMPAREIEKNSFLWNHTTLNSAALLSITQMQLNVTHYSLTVSFNGEDKERYDIKGDSKVSPYVSIRYSKYQDSDNDIINGLTLQNIPDGKTDTEAAASCKTIKDNFPSSQDGEYWLLLNTEPIKVFCNMKTTLNAYALSQEILIDDITLDPWFVLKCRLDVPKEMMDLYETIDLLKINDKAGTKQFLSIRTEGRIIASSYDYNNNNYLHKRSNSWTTTGFSYYTANVEIQHKRVNSTHYELASTIGPETHKFYDTNPIEFSGMHVWSTRYRTLGNDSLETKGILAKNLELEGKKYTIEHQDDVIKELPKMLASWSVECRLKVPKQFLEEQTTINLLQIKTNSGEFLSLKRQGKKIEFNYHSMNALFINPVEGWTHSETHEEHASLIINRKRTNTSHYELDWSINGKKSSHVSKSFEFTEVSFTSTKYHVLSTSVLTGTLSSNKQTPTETKDTVAIVTKLQENPDGSQNEGNAAESCQYLHNTFLTFKSGIYILGNSSLQHEEKVYCGFQGPNVEEYYIRHDRKKIDLVTKSWILSVNFTLKWSNTDVELNILSSDLADGRIRRLFTKQNRLFYDETSKDGSRILWQQMLPSITVAGAATAATLETTYTIEITQTRINATSYKIDFTFNGNEKKSTDVQGGLSVSPNGTVTCARYERRDDMSESDVVVNTLTLENIPDGTTREENAKSCKAIKDTFENSQNRNYWLNISGKATEIYCDMMPTTPFGYKLNEQFVVQNATDVTKYWSIETEIKLPKFIDKYKTLTLLQMNSSNTEIMSIKLKEGELFFNYRIKEEPNREMNEQQLSDWNLAHIHYIKIKYSHDITLYLKRRGDPIGFHTEPMKLTDVNVITTHFIEVFEEQGTSNQNIGVIARNIHLQNLPDGQTSDESATSCQSIKENFRTSGDGNYWISLYGQPMKVYCKMDNDWEKGGWLMIASWNSKNENPNVFSQTLHNWTNPEEDFVLSGTAIASLYQEIKFQEIFLYCDIHTDNTPTFSYVVKNPEFINCIVNQSYVLGSDGKCGWKIPLEKNDGTSSGNQVRIENYNTQNQEQLYKKITFYENDEVEGSIQLIGMFMCKNHLQYDQETTWKYFVR